MPRRPRPPSRTVLKSKPTERRQKESDMVQNEIWEEQDEPHASSSSTSEGPGESDDEDDGNDDAPRVAQWVDEDELVEDDENTDNNETDEPASKLKKLQTDLSGLPLGSLRKAQHALMVAAADSESSDSSDEEPEEVNPKGKEKEKFKPEWSIKHRTDIAKRSNKHAPVEVTSKRPVSRKRTVVDVKPIESRDPRFLPLAGEFKAEAFHKQYSFLVDAHKSELKTLRDSLKQARKLLASSPRDLFEERQKEVYRLELAIKRAESLVNKDRREAVEHDALGKLTKEEKEKRKQGKGQWWLKESEKRELLVRARYDALAADGGKRAVKKAIEKKQKKIGQKEKRSRPFAKGSAASGSNEERPRKRGPDSAEGHGSYKRRRVG